MEEIVRRSGSTKAAENEIWLALLNEQIRSASHLRGDYRPLRIRGAGAAAAGVFALLLLDMQTKQIGHEIISR